MKFKLTRLTDNASDNYANPALVISVTILYTVTGLEPEP